MSREFTDKLKNIGAKIMADVPGYSFALMVFDGDLYESGIDELNRLAEWMNEQAERQLEEQE